MKKETLKDVYLKNYEAKNQVKKGKKTMPTAKTTCRGNFET
jgi:hypothetical protein